MLAVGDSLTFSGGTDWPTTILEPLLGVDVVNFGKGGWASTDIAVRLGAVQPLLTVAGNRIPASGPVTVTAISPATDYRDNNTGGPITWTRTLAGVPGTLTHNQDPAESWVFTRTTAGSAVTCQPGTAFIDTTANSTSGER